MGWVIVCSVQITQLHQITKITARAKRVVNMPKEVVRFGRPRMQVLFGSPCIDHQIALAAWGLHPSFSWQQMLT